MLRASARARRPDFAPVFAALGDRTRLSLVGRLADGVPRSIAALTEDGAITRQAVTKHLRVLEGAGLVRAERSGRESLYALRPEPLEAARAYLAGVSRQWDDALGRLKAFVDG
ncbi:MAG TPA: metalloregulator ArsR/SmtB family transcription factor [Burkholderiales bacterium]|jgi:DNA-binding transcriptional ArsR family regulator